MANVKRNPYIIYLIVALGVFLVLLCCANERSYAAAAIKPGIPAPGYEDPTPAPQQNLQVFPTPKPQPSPSKQIGQYASPRPSPTADPMIQERIREAVERAFVIDIEPTPPKATEKRVMGAEEAAESAVEAAAASFRGMEITRLNIVKQIDSLRSSVNMAIQALDADDRYKELVELEERWTVTLEPELVFELEMYRAMDYKELNSDERRQLISIREMGYERFNLNLTRVDHNIEIVRNQLMYAAYAQYAGIAKMQAAIGIQRAALELQYANLEIIRKRYELGVATRIETENAEFSYEAALIELGRQERSLKSLVTGFNRLVGENLATSYQDFDRSVLAPSVRRMDEPADKFLARALENRSEVLLAYAEMDLAQRQAKLYETEITNFATLDDKREAEQTAEESAITYDLALQDVEDDINNAYKQLTALRGVTSYYESQIQTARENYERTQTLFELGLTTAVNVDQVRISMSQAEMMYENNLIDIWQQHKKLEIVSGIGPGRL